MFKCLIQCCSSLLTSLTCVLLPSLMSVARDLRGAEFCETCEKCPVQCGPLRANFSTR